MSQRPRWVSDESRAQDIAGACPFVIAVNGMAVVEKRRNGQSTFLTYRLRRQAQSALGRVRTTIPDARIEVHP